MFSLVSPCSATPPLPALYTGLTQNKLFLMTALGRATSDFTGEAGWGFAGC